MNAFCQLEDELRRITGAGGHESFSYLLDHVCRSNTAFNHYKDDLKEYAELRNAIVHKRLGDRPIAEPHPEAVERIEKIARMVIQAPKLQDFFHKHVEICSPQDSLKHVLDLLRKGHFNQIPVYNARKLVALLTTDCIALWLADSFANSDYIDPGARVKELLQFGSNSDDFAVLKSESSIFDAIASFDNSYKHGKHLKAIIITRAGNSNEFPLGIITTLEVPKLITLVNPGATNPVNNKKSHDKQNRV